MAKEKKLARLRGPPKKKKDGGLPPPFKQPPEILQPLIDTLNEKQVYIIHVDTHPKDFKRKIFIVPVLMNIAIIAFFIWRSWYISPYYLRILSSTLGFPNETTMVVDEMEWKEIIPEVARRGFTFLFDFCLVVFLGPWPSEFFLGKTDYGSPVNWRLNVGFRDREIIIRRSRRWSETVGRDVVADPSSQSLFLGKISAATSPMLQGEKTGYLLMDADWDLDWAGMIDATTMVDNKMAAIEAFTNVVLVYQEDYGWLSVDTKIGENAEQDERRRQIFAFRDALAVAGKEKLFYRWIEIIQYEASQPGGFGPEKQEEVARQIREMFEKESIDFDQFWKESVGTDSADGLPM
ncbi:hypothetical protein F4778DRAFT_752077 [Xylariomycetidae sp. FL2044]|nr:hypothetical protein F4778DRAFT_752077 [Xylariomycetidae sp. FL2044]